MCRIWRYGESLDGVGILVILFGNEYVLWTRVRRPPRVGVYGKYRRRIQVVGEWVLLKISLYLGKRFCKYFVDLVAVSFFSWSPIKASGVGQRRINSCKLDNAILREPTF
jgi:hypothetical protein